MATFNAQITDLVGGTVDDTACDQWTTDACKEIINQLPLKLKAKCSTISIVNATNGTTLDLDGIGEILSVTRLSADSGGYQVSCKEVPYMFGDRTNDSTDLNYYATATDPAFWTISNSSDAATLFVKPTPTDAQYANVYHITYPTVDSGTDSTIANFPDEAEYLVVLYAAIKQLHQYMNSKSSDLPSDLSIPGLEFMSASLPTWSAPSDFVAPIAPVVPAISTVDYTDSTNSDASVTGVSTSTAAAPSIIDVSGNAPTYSKPTLTTRVAFSSYTSGLTETDPGVLSVTAVAPATPELTSISFSDVSSDIDASLPTYTTATISAGAVYGGNTAPNYTKPTATGDAGLTGMEAGVLADASDLIEFDTWWDVLGDMIETNEDIEMASVQLNKISTYISAYQVEIQNELNEFNKENVVFQANIQEAMQELQVANQVNIAAAQGGLQLAISNEDRSQQRVFQNAINDMKVIFDNNSQTIQKYQSELSVYQSNVNKEIQQYGQKLQHYSTELNTAYQAWSKTESDSLQQFSTDVQNEVNEYNKENARYQTELQEALDKNNADLQVAITNANNEAQEKRQEAQQSTEMDKFNKSQDQALSLANAAKNMEKLIQDNSNKFQKYQYEISAYSAELNTNVQTFTNALTKNKTDFDTSMQKYTSEYQKVSSYNSSVTQKFQNEIADFSAKLQKQGMDYQWYQAQYAALKADYQQGLQILTGGGTNPPQQQRRQ